MSKVTVTGQIVAKNGITLFLADGTSQVMPSDSWETQGILEAILPGLVNGGKAEINLDDFTIEKQIAKVATPNLSVTETGVKLKMTNGDTIDANALKPHLEQAVYGSDAKGFKRLMENLDEMIKTRRYAATELLDHMKHGDLPIADDGSLIGYKVLTTSRYGHAEPLKPGYMVDRHSKKVVQRLGSLVYMPESKVDQSRALCSTGLHIASRGYIGGFWGGQSNDRLCLVKIKPKDVVSVPHNEATKMRVSAYHIVAVLDEKQSQAVSSGRKLEDNPETEALLANIKVGNHPPILETVEIKGDGTLTVKVLEKVRERKRNKVRPLKATRPKLDPKAVKAKAKKLKAAPALPGYAGKLAKAQAAYDGGMSIRNIAKKFGMDRESLGKNLIRKPGR